MLYVVKVYRNEMLIISTTVLGMDEVDKFLTVYDDKPGYEVDWEPDVFRYINANRNEALN